MRLQAMTPWVRYLVSTRQKINLTQLASRTCSFTSISCLVSTTTPAFRSQLSTNDIRILKAKMSMCRQNYSEECEAGVNRQINLELYASYVYYSMAFHFNRDDVALPGFYQYFKKMSAEEREHAEKLMKYQNLRGGRIALQDIKKPEIDVWGSGLEAMMAALKLEKHVNQSLLDLHTIAENKNDPQAR
uniref:Ferritin n=1 Tax=Arion vulgaris TaxID=1028688 RepID=A0A0B6Z1Q9_9EUPU